jgi:hypothetical protein
MPLPSTRTAIATTTLSSNTAEISFTNIPNIYTDLIVVINGGRSSTVTNGINIRFNTDSGTNYSSTRMWKDGTGVSTDRFVNNSNIYDNTLSYNAIGGAFIGNFFNYANSGIFKTVLCRSGSANSNVAGDVSAIVGLWRSTSVVSSIQFQNDFGSANSFLSGTTATLYGIKAAS